MVDKGSKSINLLVEPLTRREREILTFLRGNLTGPEIAEKLTIATSSVKWYLRQIYGKLGVHSRRQAVTRAYELGLLENSPASFMLLKPEHNLPRQLTSFIGREKEIAQVKSLLEKYALVTLTGSGGVGKTRLALGVAEEVLERYPDGVWQVDLATLTDPDLLAHRVAAVLGLRKEGNHPIQETLVDFLRHKGALIVLDNCEHLNQACASLASLLLQACPQIRLLVTSREVLGIGGERPHRVPSMDFPNSEDLSDLVTLQGYAAIRLFVERTQAVLPVFQMNEQNHDAVVQICQRLDGIPLALELAAARMSVLTAEELARRLDDVFRLLTGGSRTALPRHQTLWSTIDWSHNLLGEKERSLLRRLSVFTGGCTLEAAEAVCAADSIEPGEILDLLSSLVNKSIVLAERKQGVETRYHMLETVRQFARDRLTEAGESEALFEQHGWYFVQFAETGGLKLWSSESLEWTSRLNADLDNLRAAVQWFYGGGRHIAAGLRIAVAVGRMFMQAMGLIEEARQWLLHGLSAWEPASDRLLQARALNVLGNLGQISTDILQRFEENVRICRSIGPVANAELSDALMGVAMSLILLHEDWDLETARTLAEESVSVARQLDPPDRWYLTKAMGSLVDIYLRRRTKDYKQIRRLAEENLQLCLEIGDRRNGGRALWTLAEFAELQGDFVQAHSYLKQALILYQEAEDQWGVTLTYRNLGRLFRHQNKIQMAIVYDREYLRIWDALGVRSRVSDGLRRLGIDHAFLGGSLAGAGKDSALLQAVKTLGAVEKRSGDEHIFVTPADIEDFHRTLELLHGQLDPAVFEKAWAEGRALTLDEAVKQALSLSFAEPDR